MGGCRKIKARRSCYHRALQNKAAVPITQAGRRHHQETL